MWCLVGGMRVCVKEIKTGTERDTQRKGGEIPCWLPEIKICLYDVRACPILENLHNWAFALKKCPEYRGL